MTGAHKKFVAIESKSDLVVEGGGEDILIITDNGRGRRFSIFQPEYVALWLLRA